MLQDTFFYGTASCGFNLLFMHLHMSLRSLDLFLWWPTFHLNVSRDGNRVEDVEDRELVFCVWGSVVVAFCCGDKRTEEEMLAVGNEVSSSEGAVMAIGIK